MVAARFPSVYNEESVRMYVYVSPETVELVATFPDHKVTFNAVASSSLAVKLKVTTPLTLRYQVAEPLESKVIPVKVGISLSMVNTGVSYNGVCAGVRSLTLYHVNKCEYVQV